MTSTGACSTYSHQDENRPLWNYVTKLEKVGDKGGGNFRFQCTFCHGTFTGSYTRVKAHLLKQSGVGIQVCRKLTTKDIAELRNAVEEVESRVMDTKPKIVPLPPPIGSLCGNTNSFIQEAYEPKKRKISVSGSERENPIEKLFNARVAREHMNSEIAKMFYSAGLPFHLAKNPYYISSFTLATKSNILGFLPPSYNMLRTTLLQKEKANIDRLLQPTKDTWKEKGVSIVSDGWSDSQRRPLINFMAVTDGWPMFLKAVDGSGEIKDKLFIASLIKEVILEVGPQNVVQVITDNAPNCEQAGQLIEEQFANIFWTPCLVHTLNLSLKNICMAKNVEKIEIVYEECGWIVDVHRDVVMIKNFIMNHSRRLTIFSEFACLKLLSVAETRFASIIVMLRRFKLIKGGLQAMVISDKWSSYREDDLGMTKFVKDKVLNDIWWDKIDYILAFTAPIYDMIRTCDTDKPRLHLVYDMWDTMTKKVKMAIYRHERKQQHEVSTFYDVVYGILVERWSNTKSPLYCLAHSLNPRYYCVQWLNEGPNRVPPHLDLEVSVGRTSCLKKYFNDPLKQEMVQLEYTNFSTHAGRFEDSDSISDRYTLDPKCWWAYYGARAPLLQTLALKLLGQPSSSSCCERNWSTYSFIHSLKRNKMAPQCAKDLVFVHSNLRLLSRRSPQYLQGETKMWDIAGDAFDSLEGVGMLEVADLSLDEPEMEAVLFTDDGSVGDENESH